MNAALRVQTDLGRIEDGVTNAHQMLLENGAEYIVKGPSFSPGHPLVAANELVSVRLANHLGLPTNDHRIATLGDDLFFASAWMTSGTHVPFVTRGRLAMCSNANRVYDIVVFDVWLANRDRHPRNLTTRIPRRDGDEFLILNDHSHCPVYVDETSDDLPGLINLPVEACVKPFLRDAIASRALLDASIASVTGVDDAVIRAVVASVPPKLIPDPAPARYVDFLTARRTRVRRLFEDGAGTFPNLR